MRKSAFISDLIFTFLLTDVFFLCFFRYLGLPFFLSVLLSALCGIIATLGVGFLSQNKRKRLRLKRNEETLKEKLLTHLSLLSDAQKTQLFQRVLSPEKETKRFTALRLADDTRLYFLRLRFAPVNADDVAPIARLHSTKEKILVCNLIDEEALTLCKHLGIRVWTGEEVYAKIKAANALPETFLGEPTPQNKRKIRLRLCFSKKNSRRFLSVGCLLLLSSLITPFPLYYLIFGTILLCIAAGIRIFGYAD